MAVSLLNKGGKHMKFYLVSTIRGHFKLFTNKKDAIAYKKEHDVLQKEYDRLEYKITHVVIKKKQDVLNLVNSLAGEPEEEWGAFY
tara:strand:- start:117 stop:374 length:258 start_codon:yes stop_codon:yes gene_type:complete